jgi:pimeloyl-ACP methyl ester carboxylesterase
VLEATALAGFRERRLDIRGVTLRYLVGGSGPPSLLVHGLGGSAANWAELASVLARRHRVLIPDLPGHGGSAPLPAAHGLASFADRIALLAEHERAVPATVLGHSLGGAIATRLAIRRPESVESLVLFAAGGLLDFPRWRRAGMRLARALRPAERYLARNAAEVARRPRLRRVAFGGWGAFRPEALTPIAVLGFLESAGQKLDTRTARQALIAERCREELDEVECPTLVVWGARDRLVPLEVGFEYARRLRAPLRVLPAAGHLVIGEFPHECARLVEEFLAAQQDTDHP